MPSSALYSLSHSCFWMLLSYTNPCKYERVHTQRIYALATMIAMQELKIYLQLSCASTAAHAADDRYRDIYILRMRMRRPGAAELWIHGQGRGLRIHAMLRIRGKHQLLLNSQAQCIFARLATFES